MHQKYCDEKKREDDRRMETLLDSNTHLEPFWDLTTVSDTDVLSNMELAADWNKVLGCKNYIYHFP